MESGHIHCDCKKAKKKPLPDQPESMNQVVGDSDDKAFAISNIESDADSMPELETIYNSKEEINSVDDKTAKGWFLDIGNNWETLRGMGYVTDELSGVDSKGSSFVDVDPELVGEQSEDPEMDQDSPFVSVPALEEITTAISGGPSDIHVELYNSGTTCHISPYCDMFKTFVQTPPKFLNAANKGKFITIGKGDMVIKMPNGIWPSQL